MIRIAKFCFSVGRMEELGVVFVILGLVLISNTVTCSSGNGVTVSCMMVYEQGGAPAVFDSEECLQWPSLQNHTPNCQFAQLQGDRRYQEDRISCHLHMKIIPLIGENRLQEVRLGIAAVFDGHGGEEASETGSNLLSDYFHLHYVFKMYKLMGQFQGEFTANDSESLQLEVIKEALLSTIYDIDAKFTQEAVKNNLLSGSTATVIVLFDGKILVANVGDSKAIIFSEIESGQGPEASLSAIELTKDHHPDQADERARIEATGGSVIVRGVPRVNGILAMSRAIGDIYLKRYGVIAVPEVTGWQHISGNDRYLVVASDGIFESLKPNDVGDLILKWDSHYVKGPSSTLAEFIVKTAYDEGSTDNLSVIVIPLS
ncbi:probable protein phosphatase 2C 51 [Pistacia vera]|uniref:probable protein phosphatase 2C 51 n=1 Tax=Pistacia vera TaxID=55513 RepID=UPI0012633228|nr:probable protein phosphatase 2C 51 [Pistacia vera]